VGQRMEVQSCDPDLCNFLCGLCAWDACTVDADHESCCDVTIQSEGERVLGVANRFLRNPPTHRNARSASRLTRGAVMR
jgi:hypothetical protein